MNSPDVESGVQEKSQDDSSINRELLGQFLHQGPHATLMWWLSKHTDESIHYSLLEEFYGFEKGLCAAMAISHVKANGLSHPENEGSHIPSVSYGAARGVFKGFFGQSYAEIPLEESFKWTGRMTSRFNLNNGNPLVKIGVWNLNMLNVGYEGHCSFSRVMRGQMPDAETDEYLRQIHNAVKNTQCDIVCFIELTSSFAKKVTDYFQQREAFPLSPGSTHDDLISRFGSITLQDGESAPTWKVVESDAGRGYGGTEMHLVCFRNQYLKVSRTNLADLIPKDRSLKSPVNNRRTSPHFRVALKVGADEFRDIFYLRTVHDSFRSKNKKDRIWNEVVEMIGDDHVPTIVLGDFNVAGEDALKAAQKSISDAGKSGLSVERLKHPSVLTTISGRCIDNIFVISDLDRVNRTFSFVKDEVSSCDIRDMRCESWWGPRGNWLSDHFLISAELEVFGTSASCSPGGKQKVSMLVDFASKRVTKPSPRNAAPPWTPRNCGLTTRKGVASTTKVMFRRCIPVPDDDSLESITNVLAPYRGTEDIDGIAFLHYMRMKFNYEKDKVQELRLTSGSEVDSI